MRLGGISGAGNALVRKLAVEGSWCYAQAGHQPKLMPKGSGVPLEIRMHGVSATVKTTDSANAH